MAISIADLQAKQAAMLSKIKNKVESNGSSYRDERFWEPTFDKEKGGGAVIRFLPSPDGADALPYANIITHFFQGSNGKYYAENSLRTLDKKDPVSELNFALFNSGITSNQNQARNQKQKPRWFANILVIRDPGNPSNEGKTFLYKFGPAVWNMIEEQLFPNDPTDPDKESVNPFNVFDGVNLNLKLVPQPLGKNIVPNYNKSHFDYQTSPLSNDNEKIAELVNSGHSLVEFTDPSNFKTYNELAKKLVEVLGPTTGTGIPTVAGWEEEVSQQPTPQKVEASVEELIKTAETQAPTDDSEEDDALAKLKAMMEDE